MIEEIKDVMIKIGNILKNFNTRQGVLDYVKMAECTNALLAKVFEGKEYTLPLDINKVIKYLEIEVIEESLNDMSHVNKSNQVVGELSIQPQIFGEKEMRAIIYIDSGATLYTQRYAVAHEIGHYLINMQKMIFGDEYCIMPMLPKDAEELVADTFAISLLIPIKAFIKEFGNYVEEERKNKKGLISTEDWLQYLSTTARVSYHYVACGYQQLRYVAFWLYQYKKEKMMLLDAELDEEKRKNLQTEVEEKEKECRLLTNEIEDYLSEDVINRLFQ